MRNEKYETFKKQINNFLDGLDGILVDSLATDLGIIYPDSSLVKDLRPSIPHQQEPKFQTLLGAFSMTKNE